MIYLTQDSTNKEIKNVRNITYFALTGAFGLLRSVAITQEKYWKYLRMLQRVDPLRIKSLAEYIDQQETVLCRLSAIVNSLEVFIQYYRSEVLTKEKKPIKNKSG